MVEHFKVKFGYHSCHRFLRYHAKKQTDKLRWKPYPATAVGKSNINNNNDDDDDDDDAVQKMSPFNFFE